MTEKEKKENDKEMKIDWEALEEYWANEYEDLYAPKN